MTTALAPSPVPVSDRFTSRWVDDGHRASYTVDDGERVVSEGMVGVLGADAIIDAVETSPGHRRQGLGRHVIGALTIWAVDHGARTGLMAATADGASLYTALGWDTTMVMWSLMGVRDD